MRVDKALIIGFMPLLDIANISILKLETPFPVLKKAYDKIVNRQSKGH